jgi:2-methylcitrate dehydratase PrpD
MTNTLATAYSDFCSALRSPDIPEEVRRSARWHVVDSVGVAIAAADPDEETGAALRRAADLWCNDSGTGATVLGTGQRLPPESAALINGSLAQALEMDDKHGSSLARPGSTVIPAALAVAEHRGASIGELLASVAAGYEVMIRLGFVAGKRFLARGYHTSALIGGFGSVAAIGNLNGLTAAEIGDALGIAGTLASGIQESTRTGSTSKVLHGGWGALAGIIATDLARSGITGPSSVFEGEMGFFSTHLTPIEGALDWVKPAAELGSRWYLPDTAIKPYPCCQLLHAFIVGVRRLLVELDDAGVAVTDIDRITCRLAEPGLTLVTQPVDRKIRPTESHEARFSLPYVVAHTLIHRNIDLSTFRSGALDDNEVQGLAARVRTGEDPESDYPAHCPAVIDIDAGGRTFHKRVPYHPGCPEAPMTEDDILDKFERNSAWLLGSTARKVGAEMAAMPEDALVDEMLGLLDTTNQPSTSGRHHA